MFDLFLSNIKIELESLGMINRCILLIDYSRQIIFFIFKISKTETVPFIHGYEQNKNIY